MSAGKYDDIIHLSRPISHHPRMSDLQRAAQFSPFAALSGYEDAIEEQARYTNSRIELAESELQELDRKLRDAAEKGARVEIIRFVPDERKAGGRYETVSGRILKVDPIRKVLHLDTGAKVIIENIMDVGCL